MHEFVIERFYPYRELASFLPEVSNRVPEKISMYWPDRIFTYSELELLVSKLASAIRGFGLTKGDRVGALMLNSPEMVISWLACLRLGLVFVPYNSALKGELLAYQIKDSKPKILFVDSALVGNIPKACINGVKMIIRGSNDENSFDNFIQRGDKVLPQEVKPSDIAEVIYTSGTTGTPKGVLLPHYSFINRAREIASIVELRDDDVFLNALPLFHTSGQVMTTLPALMGGFTVAEDYWFHVSNFWRLASISGATISFLLMRTVNLLLRAEKNFVNNRLRVIMCGGVGSEHIIEFEKKFGIRLLEGFGMTETCGIAVFNTLRENKLGSIGKPLPSVVARVVKEDGSEVKDDEVGELYLSEKIPNTMYLGYLGGERRRFREQFPTGDLVRVDRDGFYYYVERKKDIIRCREENVIPSQIERVVEQYDGVVESAAIGIPSELGEEILLALKVDRKIDTIELLRYLDSRLPFYMIPKYILYLDELPKTPNQKISREQIRRIGISGAIDVESIGFKAKKPI